MPTALPSITRIQDCDDYADALSWAGGVVFNEAGADVDFRVEGVGEPNALFVQGSNGYVGIRTATPAMELHVAGNIALPSTGEVRFDDGVGPYIKEAGNGLEFYAGSAGAYKAIDINGNGQTQIGSAWFDDDLSGNVGIGTTDPNRLLHAEVSDAVTNAVTYGLRLSHITSGEAAAGFGTGIEFELEDAGGGMDVAGVIQCLWISAAAGSETSRLSISCKHTGGTGEGMRVSGVGAAVAIGFFGSGQLQQAHIVDAANAAGDPPTQAEYNAFVAKFNTLLADLEGYGLLASA